MGPKNVSISLPDLAECGVPKRKSQSNIQSKMTIFRKAYKTLGLLCFFQNPVNSILIKIVNISKRGRKLD
jgi:hypothetical protein